MDITDPEGFLLRGGVPSSPALAFNIQRKLSKKVITARGFENLTTVAGADLSILKDEKRLLCGIIVFTYPGLEEIERVYTKTEERFPYIPGLLAFREGPAIIETWDRLRTKPDLLIIDGQGTAHPRGFGIACHVGVTLGVPAMGIAKKRLYGSYTEPGEEKGSRSALLSREGGVIGAVLRTKDLTKPVFVSPGHKIDLDTACEVALSCARGRRIPEPTRLADVYVAALKKEAHAIA